MRSTSPTDRNAQVAARLERIAALDYPYASRPKHAITRCNLCGGSEFVVVAHRDRYGYPAGVHGCRRCGLVFLNPVMTAEAYKEFYAGVYRPLVSAYHGRLIDAQTIQAEQREYAAARGDFLDPFVKDRGYTTQFDIGGSTGVVAHAFSSRFGLKGTVIDPSPPEIEEARRFGLETVVGLVEDYDAGSRRFDVVIMCQTVDHLLDIDRSLRAVRGLINPAGVFFVDIVDLRAGYLRNWAVEDTVKIDHPYYLTEQTMESYLKRTGFEVVRVGYAADHLHVSYVCRPGASEPGALPKPESVDALWREIRFVQNARGPA